MKLIYWFSVVDYEKFVYENYRLPGGADDPEGAVDAPPAEEGEAPAAAEPAVEEAPPAPEEEAAPPPETIDPGAESAAEPATEPADEPSESNRGKSAAAAEEDIDESPPVHMPSEDVAEYEKSEQPLISEPGDDESDTDLVAPKIAEQVIEETKATLAPAALPPGLIESVRAIRCQMDLVMEQLLLATYILLSKPTIPELFYELYDLSQKMRTLRKENLTYLNSQEPSLELKLMPSLVWSKDMLHIDCPLTTCDVVEEQNVPAPVVETEEIQGRDITEGHLCYSNERLMDELLDLKSELCQLINKVNELTAKILQQESQQTVRYIKELQEQMKDSKNQITILKSQVEADGLNINQLNSNTDKMQKNIEELRVEKVDKTELDILLSDKVDYTQLQRKVSLDQLLELQCRMDKRLCEVSRVINENDARFRKTIEELENTLGFAAIEGILNKFRDQIEDKINNVQSILQKYMDSTNDECAAAGARVKVLQDLTCLSCDTNCVMRSMEKAKVAKLPNAHASNMLSPVITYELGTIRKSGVMGYYRKDDFPHAPNAWMGNKNNNFPMKQCVPRHAGGPHTTHTAKERMAKMSVSKK